MAYTSTGRLQVVFLSGMNAGCLSAGWSTKHGAVCPLSLPLVAHFSFGNDKATPWMNDELPGCAFLGTSHDGNVKATPAERIAGVCVFSTSQPVTRPPRGRRNRSCPLLTLRLTWLIFADSAGPFLGPVLRTVPRRRRDVGGRRPRFLPLRGLRGSIRPPFSTRRWAYPGIPVSIYVRAIFRGAFCADGGIVASTEVLSAAFIVFFCQIFWRILLPSGGVSFLCRELAAVTLPRGAFSGELAVLDGFVLCCVMVIV